MRKVKVYIMGHDYIDGKGPPCEPDCYKCEDNRFCDWYNGLTDEELAALEAEHCSAPINE